MFLLIFAIVVYCDRALGLRALVFCDAKSLEERRRSILTELISNDLKLSIIAVDYLIVLKNHSARFRFLSPKHYCDLRQIHANV